MPIVPPSRQHRKPTLKRALPRALKLAAVALAVIMLAAGSTSAQTGDKVSVRTRPKIGEYQPAAAGGYIAWEQNTKARPDHFNVYAKPVGGSKLKLNKPGTQGAMGGIQGTSAVYQQFWGRASNVKFFNLTTKKRTSPKIYINTKLWEYWPSMSGSWVLFGRRTLNGNKRKVILYNRSTQGHRILDRTKSPEAFIAPGQVNGNFVVWYRCKAERKCNVYRYRIDLKVTKKIPNPKRKDQHSPSVTADGIVYFAKGTKICGTSAKLMRYVVGNGSTKIMAFKDGFDVGDTYVNADESGAAEVLFEQNRCRTKAGSDIFKVMD
ncbi:MAG: hypothetical protein ABR529_07370 [Actinomycetota bacterium]